MLGLKLNHVSKRGHWGVIWHWCACPGNIHSFKTWIVSPFAISCIATIVCGIDKIVKIKNMGIVSTLELYKLFAFRKGRLRFPNPVNSLNTSKISCQYQMNNSWFSVERISSRHCDMTIKAFEMHHLQSSARFYTYRNGSSVLPFEKASILNRV